MGGWLGSLAASALGAATSGDPKALAALFLVAALTELGVPFPLLIDGVLFILGNQLLHLWPGAVAVVLVLMVGREMGAASAYWLCRLASARLGSRVGTRFPRLRRVVASIANRVGASPAMIALSRMGIQSSTLASIPGSGVRLSYTVALARITPGLLTAASAFFGIIGLRYEYFALGIGLSSIFVDIAIVGLGAVAGYGLVYFGIVPSPWLIIVGAAGNILLVWWVSRLLWRRNSLKNPPEIS